MISQAVALATVACWMTAGTAPEGALPGVRARVQPSSTQFPLNHPVWVQFSLENTNNDPITLTVPGTEPQIPPPEMGLPLSHVFSGGSPSASGWWSPRRAVDIGRSR